MNASATTTEAAAAAGAAARHPLQWLQWLEGLGDRLNPILIKETRQALKSRQFTFTFVLVLVACWVWTFLGLAMIGPRVYYSAQASEMFYGYFMILAFPLAIIIPFSAFRSLAAEREDNTYELLSITNLTARQIITGKLGSALIQMIVYLSAVAPCLAFTYLLRGIDILTIAYVLYYSFFGSLGLSALALFLGTISQTRYGQVVVSVIAILGLAGTFLFAIAWTYELLRYSSGYLFDWEFWVINGIIATAYLTYFALVVFAAAGQLTFASENRSTPLRWVMFVQHGCIAGWVFYIAMIENEFNVFPVIAMMLLGIHWYVMGTLLTSESGQLSPRARRRLPQSFLGRLFLTWFNPGPGTGYMLVVSSLLGALVFGLVALLANEIFEFANSNSRPDFLVVVYFMVLMVSYVTLFLGMGRLLLNALQRFVRLPLVGSVAVHMILVAIGTLVPLVIQLMSPVLRDNNYTLLQISNPFWSLVEVADGGRLPPVAHALILIVPTAALFVLSLNWRMILADVGQLRAEKPARLVAEDAALTAAARPQRTSPWDEEQ